MRKIREEIGWKEERFTLLSDKTQWQMRKWKQSFRDCKLENKEEAVMLRRQEVAASRLHGRQIAAPRWWLQSLAERHHRRTWAPKSMSCTARFVLTRPPASRQTRAATFSRTQPRRPKTPAFAHAATVVAKEVGTVVGSMRVSFNEGVAMKAANAAWSSASAGKMVC